MGRVHDAAGGLARVLRPFCVDCKPCVGTIYEGFAEGLKVSARYALVHQLVFVAADDTPLARAICMLAHKDDVAAGMVQTRDGEQLTLHDIGGKRWTADRLSKSTVERPSITGHGWSSKCSL